MTVDRASIGKDSTIALQDQHIIGNDNDTRMHRTGPLYCGFTLKNDNEIVGRTKHRDHTQALVCSRCLLSKQGRRAVSTATGNSWFSFYLKTKKKLPLFSFSKRDTSPTSLIVLSHMFPQEQSHTYREYTRSTLR